MTLVRHVAVGANCDTGCHDGAMSDDPRSADPMLGSEPTDPPPRAAMHGRVALLGKRSSVLEPLGEALRGRGFDPLVIQVGSTAEVDRAAAHLREERFEVVAFGRAVDDAWRRQVMDAARSRNPRAQRADGYAPIIELLVAQVEYAARHSQAITDGDPVVVIEAVPDPAVIVRTTSNDIEVVRFQMGPLMRRRVTVMPVDREGSDAVAFFTRQPADRRDFVSVRVDGVCVFVGDSLGRLPMCR